jgi:rod shape-determining protein MreB and related proteins
MANSFIGRDMAVDLGTANTLVYVRGKGILLDEPSVVALNSTTGEVLAVGHEAKRMIGRTPETITAIRPLQDGVIADFDSTEQMLRFFIQQVHRRRYFAKPRLVICVPSGITAVERRAVEEATLAAGARRAYLIEEPMAGAIGAGLPVSEPYGNLVVDIGGGTSEMAVIALGGMAVSESLRIGGYELDDAIVRHVQQAHKLLIGQQQAERVKLEVGSAWQLDDEIDRVTEVAGRDLTTGLLKRVSLNAKEIREAIARPVFHIVDALRNMLERTPPELAADLGERGLVLVGGGALLRGIDERIARETQLPVSIAESPLTCVALGAGASLDEVSVLERVKRASSG